MITITGLTAKDLAALQKTLAPIVISPDGRTAIWLGQGRPVGEGCSLDDRKEKP